MKRRPANYYSSRNLENLRADRKTMKISARARAFLEDFKTRRVNPTVEVLQEALGSDLFANLTLDALHNRIVGRYRRVPAEWRRLANIRTINDFQLQRATAVSGMPDLSTVLENGEYRYVARSDEARGTYQVIKRGNIFALTMEAQANDAMGGLLDTAAAFGTAAARTLDKHVLTTNLSDNPVIYDSKELVGGDHNNWGGSGALTDATLEAAIELMFEHGGVGADDESEFEPMVLMVNPDEYFTALRIVKSDRIRAEVTANVAGEVNPLQDVVTVVKSRRIASGRRFLLADPSVSDMLEVGFYQGNQEPETFIEQTGAPAEFEMDARRTKVRYIFGTAWRDYRGIVGWGFADPH